MLPSAFRPATEVMVGANGAVASSVKLKASLTVLTLPALSVWRTVTDFAPSPLRAKLLPVNVTQFVPPSSEYSRVDPVSRPETETVPLLVTLSLSLLPVSVMLSVGLEGAAVSMLTTLSLVSEVAAPSLPAISVILALKV